ncbi:hypothetical protein N8204_02225, partial [Flavobacteriales bacterium]|nr:hypothetical protein [Flavobacteriales bacterium]
RARGLLQNPIPFIIHFQILLTECTNFHPKGLGNPFDIPGFEYRTRCFAAMGAIQTIHFFKDFIVSLMKDSVQVTRGFAHPTREQRMNLPAVFFGPSKLLLEF